MCGCLRAHGRRGEERPGAGVVWCVCAGRMRARCVRVWVCRRESLRVSRDPHLPRIARLGYHSRVPVSGVRALTSCCSRPRTSRSVSDVQTWRDCAVRGARGRVGRVDVCTCVLVRGWSEGISQNCARDAPTGDGVFSVLLVCVRARSRVCEAVSVSVRILCQRALTSRCPSGSNLGSARMR